MSKLRTVLALCTLLAGPACSDDGGDKTPDGANGDGSADGSGDGGDDGEPNDGDPSDDGDPNDDGSSDDGDEDNPTENLVETLPAGFTPGTANGGYQVVGPLEDFEQSENQACVNVLRAIIRDFTQAHVDFGEQKPATWTDPGLYTGHVLPDLGEDRKPLLNPSRMPLDVIEGLDDWYNTTTGVNDAYVMEFWLEPDATNPGSFVFDMNNFFPLDDHNLHPEDVQNGGEGAASGPHNFLFTTEIHTAFEYKAGQVFEFRGDDDVFVYIDKKLVVDLGGIHGPLTGGVNLDDLGLTEGEVYQLDMFQAERNPGGSNFRIDTSLDFKECDVIVDIPL